MLTKLEHRSILAAYLNGKHKGVLVKGQEKVNGKHLQGNRTMCEREVPE